MSQVEELYNVLQDGCPHRVDELVERVYGTPERVTTIARLGARVWDCKRRFHVEIKSWRDKFEKKLWWYQMVKQASQTDLFVDFER